MNQATLLERVFMLIPLVLSLSVHEWAHAAAAVSFGDDTPIRQGRYTLNPIAHIDPIGTLLLPLLGIPFGWAKPVQWNPSRIRRDVPMQRALWVVSIAGPASNIVLAFLAAIGLAFVPGDAEVAGVILWQFFGINVSLAVFNMLPIPPLDGSRIVDANIPRSLAGAWESVHRFAPFLLFGVFLLPPIREGLGSMIQFVARTILAIVGRISGG